MHINVISYESLLNDLQTRYNEASIILAIKTMIEEENIFIVTMNKKLFVFSNISDIKESIDFKFLDIHEYYTI